MSAQDYFEVPTNRRFSAKTPMIPLMSQVGDEDRMALDYDGYVASSKDIADFAFDDGDSLFSS